MIKIPSLQEIFNSIFNDSYKYKLVKEDDKVIKMIEVPLNEEAKDILYEVINVFSNYVLREALGYSKKRGEPVIITPSDIVAVLDSGPIDMSIKKKIN